MGQIDVSDIVASPEFVDDVTIIHRTTTVDNFGQNQLVEKSIPTFGSVQPVSGRTLMRIPEAFRVANVMSFWVEGQIIADGNNQYPDMLQDQFGVKFEVQMIFDWSAWGEGYSEGTCVRVRPTL